MHEVLVNRLGGLSLPRKSVVRLTGRPDMTLDVYRGRKTTKQQQSPLEGYPITLCDVTSNIKADRLSVSVKCQTGILHTPSSCFGEARNRFE